jgi:hypothetical protein
MAEVAAIATARGAHVQSVRLPALARVAILLSAFFGVAMASQLVMGAYRGSIGAYPDEPAHYMSGLLIHDYVLAGFPESPMAYAKRYYYHHPSLGIGYWPPAFYVAEALWMLVFGISRASVLVLGALVCSCLQLMLFWTLRRRAETLPAVIVAASLPFLPAVRYSNTMVMTDVFVALACFAATLQLGRFFYRPTVRRGMFLGLLCSLALLSKFSAAYLALVPAMTILVSRRFDLLRRCAILVPAAVVLAATLPWAFYTRGLLTLGLLPQGPVHYDPISVAVNYIRPLYGAIGPILLTALAGFIAVVFGRLRLDIRWAAIAVTPVALGIFVWFAPVALESRHVIIAIPALLMLSVYGTRAMAELMVVPRFQSVVSTLLLIGTLSAAIAAGPRSNKIESGFGQAAEYLVSASRPDSVILVSSVAGGGSRPWWWNSLSASGDGRAAER